MVVPSCCQPKLHDQRLWEDSLLEEQSRPKAKTQNLHFVFCALKRKSKQFSRYMYFHFWCFVASHILCVSYLICVRSCGAMQVCTVYVCVCMFVCMFVYLALDLAWLHHTTGHLPCFLFWALGYLCYLHQHSGQKKVVKIEKMK